VKTPVVGGRRAVLEAVRAGATAEVLVAREARSTAGLRDVLEACREAGLPVREVDRSELDGLAADHRGVVAITGSPRAIGERELAAWPFDPDDLVVVLDGITDPQNLGAAARSAEAAGARMLVPHTHRAVEVSPAPIRASAGALLHLTHARIANIARGLDRLKDAGFTVVGLDEQAERTVYEADRPEGRVAVVLGSEGEGLGRLTREACDLLVRLPIRGRVGSLNASASLAAALYSFVLPRKLGRGS
jgi:23S rRNA (guanosine2251-2'-O)-methyltransferase